MNARLAALAGVLLMAGCTLGPNFQRPTPPDSGYAHALPPAGAARTVSYGGEVADDWYHLFGSEQLDQLVRRALSGNHDLEAARHGLKAAQFELRAVAGTQLPQIDLGGQIGRARVNGAPLYAPTDYLQITGNRFELGPTLAYNIDAFGGTRRQVEEQRAVTATARDQALNT
jgi:outer membrane protein TolC